MKHQRNAIARTVIASILIIIIVAAAALGFYFTSAAQKTSSSTTSSSSATASSSSQADSTLTWANATPQTSIDPDVNQGDSNSPTISQFYESLLNENAAGQFTPGLATSWTASSDGLHYTFTLRQGVLFHDMTPFNATAVVVSLQRALGINTGLPYSFLAGSAANATIISNYQVEINLSHLNPDFLATIASLPAFPIISPSAVKAHELNSTEMAQGWFADHEDGTGPYMLTNYNPGVSSTATQFPQYWQGWNGNHFKNIYMTAVTDTTTRNLDLTSGQTDIVEDLSPTEVTALTSPYVADNYPARSIVYDMFDLTNPYLSQLNFRTAIAYAINYTGLVANVEQGQSTQAIGPLPSSMVGFNSSLPVPQQNVALAKQYLAKTNYTSSGSPTLTIAWNDYAWKQQTCEAISSDLAAVGINVKIVQVTYPVLAAGLASPGTYDMYIFFQSTWVNGPFAILNTVYNGTYVSLPPKGNNPIAPLLAQASGEANDQTAYLNTLMHIQSVAVQNHYQLFLYDLEYNYAYNSHKVSGYAYLYSSDPTESPDFYNITPVS